MKLVKILSKCTILKDEPLSPFFKFLSQNPVKLIKMYNRKNCAQRPKSRVMRSSDLQLEHFEGQDRVTYI